MEGYNNDAEKKINIEILTKEINELLDRLDEYGDLYNKVSTEIQDEWYAVEQEAVVGKDENLAIIKSNLERFLKILEEIKNRTKIISWFTNWLIAT